MAVNREKPTAQLVTDELLEFERQLGEVLVGMQGFSHTKCTQNLQRWASSACVGDQRSCWRQCGETVFLDQSYILDKREFRQTGINCLDCINCRGIFQG